MAVLGLLLSIVGGCVLLSARYGQPVFQDSARNVDLVVVLLAAGINCLLASRRPVAFWLVFTTVGAVTYLSEQATQWSPPGWHDRVIIISVVVFAQGTLLAVLPSPRDDFVAILLLGLVGGLLWLGHHFRTGIPWGRHWQGEIMDVFLVFATIVLGLRLRSAQRDRIGFVLALGGVTLFVLEQLRHWAPDGWHSRVITVSLVTAVVGVTVSVIGHVEGGRYGRAFFVAIGWGFGTLIVSRQQSSRLRIDETLANGVEVVSAALIVVAVAAAAHLLIDLLADSFKTFVTIRSVCALLVNMSSAAFGIGVIALTILPVFDGPSLLTVALLLLSTLAFVAGFLGIWLIVMAVAERSQLTGEPRSGVELENFLSAAVLGGPRELGQGPLLCYCGAVVLVSCWLIIGSTAAWFSLGLLGAALLVFGCTRVVRRILQQVHDRSFADEAADPASRRLSEKQFEVQERLLPRSVAYGGASIVMLLVLRSDRTPAPLPFLLSLLVIAGLFVACAAPVHYLVATQAKHADFDWRSALDDRHLQYPARVAAVGLLVGIAATIWSSSFELYGWLEPILTLCAVFGLCAAFVFGLFTISTVTDVLRTGDRTLGDRVRRISTSSGKLYRLLPAPRHGEFQPHGEPRFDLDDSFPYRQILQ